jgi:hypothetical protein
MTPDVVDIWSTHYWNMYKAYNIPLHTRTYYKVRSIVRLVVWAPFVYITFVGVLVVFG